MIRLGIQGPVKPKEHVEALHICADEMAISLAQPCLMEFYRSHPQADHAFPLKIWMHVVPKMDLVLNTKGWKSVDKLWCDKILGTHPN